MAEARKCEHCGAALGEGSHFCGSCGKASGAGAAKQTIIAGGAGLQPPPGPSRSTTPGQGAAGAGEGAREEERDSHQPEPDIDHQVHVSDSDRAHDPGRTTVDGVGKPTPGTPGRTMMGLPGGSQPPGSATGSQPPDSATSSHPPEKASSSHPPAGAPPGAAGRTLMGMPQVTDEVIAAATRAREKAAATREGAASQPEPAPAKNATVMGLQPPTPGAPAAASSGPAPGRPSQAKETVVGIPAEEGSAPPTPSGPAGGEPPHPKASGGRTMLGVGLEDAPAPAAGAPTVRTARTRNDGDDTEPAIPLKRGPSPVLLAALAALALLAGAAAFALIPSRPEGPGVVATVVREGGRERMVFEVPGAPPGAKLRFGGIEKPLDAGRVSFPLGTDSLRVGRNVVRVEVIGPDGSVRPDEILLELQHRVILDTSPLAAGKAAVDVVVVAVPGSQVTLDGEPLLLDAQGRGVRSDPIDVADGTDGGVIEHHVKYRVQPPHGEPIVDELHTRIPVASLQVDRPGRAAVTDRDAIEIAGSVGRGTAVTIDGKAVEVADGRFLHRLPLPRPGLYQPVLLATARGKAPNRRVLEIRRVEDLAQAARSFQPAPDLDYARIAQNPAIYRGRKVAFEGRVYNVAVQGGQSVLQVLVRDCPEGTRCPLWVTHGAATDFTIDDWVKVLGTVEGEQQFRAENDQVRSVPKVAATFLLPAEP